MVIQHNLVAMNAKRTYGITTVNKAKSTEKLSSGYRINRAGDDAAGLSISEKMRRQIRGLEQGSYNITDGIGLVQTAEGAMGEIVDCLQRMNELTVKAYNDTNQKVDREYIQDEINNLLKEIDRIGEATTFNEKKLMRGNPWVDVMVEPSYKYMDMVPDPELTEVKMPAWMSLDNNMSLDNYDASILGDKSQISIGRYLSRAYVYGSNGAKTEKEFIYYGPESTFIKEQHKPDGSSAVYTRAGDWSQSLDNNVCTKMDFSGLSGITDADELYDSVKELLGYSVSLQQFDIQSEYHGVLFTGTIDGVAVENGAQVSVAEASGKVKYNMSHVDLSRDRILVSERGCSEDYNPPSVFGQITSLKNDTTLSEDEKKQKTQQLASDIALGLASRTTEAVNQGASRNVYAVDAGGGKLAFYDLRDADKLVADTTSKVFNGGKVQMLREKELTRPAVFEPQQKPIIIQCSAEVPDEIPIELPLLDLSTLTVKDFTIVRYHETWEESEQWKKKYENWLKTKDHSETITSEIHHPAIPAQPAWTEKNVPYQHMTDPGGPYKYYDHFGNEYEDIKPPTFETRYKDVEHPAIEGRDARTETVTFTRTWEDPMPQKGPGDVVLTSSVYDPDSIERIKYALQEVTKWRSYLGATQNRLEHAYNNNRNKEENTTAAESRIRDTDMAKEMVGYSNNNILAEAGQTMLAQANQSKQGILTLIG